MNETTSKSIETIAQFFAEEWEQAETIGFLSKCLNGLKASYKRKFEEKTKNIDETVIKRCKLIITKSKPSVELLRELRTASVHERIVKDCRVTLAEPISDMDRKQGQSKKSIVLANFLKENF